MLSESGQSEMRNERAPDFERHAASARGRTTGPPAEFWYFLRQSGKWWMAPIVLALLTVGALLVVSGSAIAPLIYAVF